MYCPYCGAKCEMSHIFCYQCGKELPRIQGEAVPEPVEEIAPLPVPETVEEPEATLPEAAASEPEPIENPTAEEFPADLTESNEPAPEDVPKPAPKKGRLWPPLAILGVMICTGLLVFFLSNFEGPQEMKSETPWFTVENGVLDFHAEYYTGGAELTIPKLVDGQTVTAIADHAFSGCDLISTVILPDTVLRIGDYAFSSCHNLRGVYIPSTVDLVGVYAFADCDSLEAIYIPGNLVRMGHGSLDSCESLRYILFNGTYAQWNDLYDGYFVSDVELHTTDGIYYTQP